MEFILSDATPDRYGDIIIADGWDLKNFQKNPIALFNHDSNFPVGRWEGLRVENGALRGHLKLAPEGTSPRLDEIRKLVDAGILRAVSVGFQPLDSEPLKAAPGKMNGFKYTKSELVETSLVAIPANPNALSVAKSLRISDDTMKLVFAKNGEERQQVVKSVPSGKHAETSQIFSPKRKAMNAPLAQQITDTEQLVVAARDALSEHLKTVDSKEPTDEQTTITTELTAKVERFQNSLESLKRAEQRIASTIVLPPRSSEQAMEIKSARPFAIPRRKVDPVEYIFRSLTVQVKHHAEKGRRTMVEVMKDLYGEDEGTHAVMNVLTRAATAPATTTTAGWAQELVTVAIGEFFGLLQPVSV